MPARTARRWSVTAEAVVADEETPSLEIPAEPGGLRRTIRHEVLGGADWQETFGDSLGLGDVLWSCWSPVLEAGGMTRASFDSIVRAYRRELWFWVLGDRRWEQAIDGLAGRLLRRLPSP